METLIAAIEKPFFVTNNNNKNNNKKKNQPTSFIAKKKEEKEEVLMTIEMPIYCPTYDKYGKLVETSNPSINLRV